MFRHLLFIVLFFTSYPPAWSQPNLLQSGPMVGYSEMTEAMIWVQTAAVAEVSVEAWPVDSPTEKTMSHPKTTSTESGLTAHFTLTGLKPGTTYQYRVRLNDQEINPDYPLEFQTQALWQYRTDPPEFSIALGSCAYINEPEVDRPGNPYGGDYQIFQSIHQKDPDAMIWLGDNVYFREVDWYTRSGMIHRYTHSRSIPELQPLLGSTHHYAIWDDHDFGPNNSDRSFIEKETALDVFKLFWANKNYGIDDIKGALGFFQWGDVDVFLLDNRYYRTPNNRKTGERTILGHQQREWLIDALASSQAPFKLVVMGGQFLNPMTKYETYATFSEERQWILDQLEANNIWGVVFISGDRHHTVLSKLDRPSQYPLYDITISPLTSGAYGAEEPENTLQVEGTLVGQRNFGILKVSGPRRNRVMTIEVFDTGGTLLWTQKIEARDLRP